MNLTSHSILTSLDNSIAGDYNDFIDLGHGYFELANSRLTVYKNSNDWAIVFEKFGYNPRTSTGVGIEIAYFGNCLQNMESYNNQSTNYRYIPIENDIEEALSENRTTIRLGKTRLIIPLDTAIYTSKGIPLEYDSSLYVGAVLRYIVETNPNVTRASDNQKRKCLPNGINELFVIDEWYDQGYHKYDQTHPPSKNPFFIELANSIVNDTTLDMTNVPKPNTNWRNWLDSGQL